MEKIKKVLEVIIFNLMIIVMAILVIGAIWQVISRYCLNSPSLVTEELLRYSLIWAALIGSCYGFIKNEHMELTFIKDKFKGRKREIINVIIDLVVLSFAILVFFYGGSALVKQTWTQKTPILQLSMGVVYSILPISGILISIIKLINMTESVKKIINNK